MDEGLVSGLVGCDSGELFIGPGEIITGGGLEPSLSSDGLLLPCQKGTYKVWVEGTHSKEIVVWLEPILSEPQNSFTDYPRLSQ